MSDSLEDSSLEITVWENHEVMESDNLSMEKSQVGEDR
jgi:hypothetical protein